MKIKLTFASIITFVSLSHVSAVDNGNTPPKATTEEAKIKFWRVPNSKLTFWNIPELKKAHISLKPIHMQDGIPVGQLGLDGGDKNIIQKLAEEISDKKHTEVDSLLIAHKGKLIFESYFSRGRVDLPHPQSSTTKSYTSLATGRAIQLGYLTIDDLDRPISKLLKNLDHSKLAKGVEKITLNKLLSMKSGIQISQERMDEYRKNPTKYTGMQLVQSVLEDSAPITEKSQTFNYVGFNVDIVMQILDVIVPGSSADFVKNELFGKMGITNYAWQTTTKGLLSAGGNSSMTSRNMLKIGTLVMNKGQWNGKQLISKEFIEKSINRNVELSPEQTKRFYSGDKISNSAYGYFWWLTDLKAGDKNYQSISAQGGGGVSILFIKELDLVVVVTAHSQQAFLQMIAEKILPAFSK